MFVKLSCKIADRLEHCGIISKSNRTLYEYGLRQMTGAVGSHENHLEAVRDLLQAVFNSNTGHFVCWIDGEKRKIGGLT